MERVDRQSEPYRYPSRPHQRRHGPAGYSTYENYRPWLEDDFLFRCVYCLKRMVWAPTDVWAIDHVISQDEASELECEYDNLVFACQCCNRQKSWHRVADPCLVAYGTCLRVEPSGMVTPLNSVGQRLVNTIRLNHPRYVDERLKTIRHLRAIAEIEPSEFQRLMGFPGRLPDLSALKPPKGNRRPQGVAESCLARRARGELPKT
jgi:hypothetical protein